MSFEAAFANEGDGDGIAPHAFNPYHLSSVYDDVADAGSSLLGGGGDEDGDDAAFGGWDRPAQSAFPEGAAPARPKRSKVDRGPAPPLSRCDRCLDAIPCCFSIQKYRRIRERIQDPKAAQLTRSAFWLHWFSVTSYLVNCALFTYVFMGTSTPASGSSYAQVSGLFPTIWSYVYLFLGTIFSWFGCAKALFSNFEKVAESSALVNWWYTTLFLWFYTAYSTYMCVGFSSAGAGGALALVGIFGWKPLSLPAVILSSIFTAMQGMSVLWAIYLNRSLSAHIASPKGQHKGLDV